MKILRIEQRPQNRSITVTLPAEFPLQDEVEIIVLPYREKRRVHTIQDLKFRNYKNCYFKF